MRQKGPIPLFTSARKTPPSFFAFVFLYTNMNIYVRIMSPRSNFKQNIATNHSQLSKKKNHSQLGRIVN